MKALRLLMFLTTIPLLAAIGYDAYLNIHNNEQEIKLTAVGFVWMQNSPETFNQIRDYLDPQQYQLVNDYILEQKTILVTGVLAGFFWVLYMLSWLLSAGKAKKSIRTSHKNRKVDVILGEAEEKKFKYKRK